ncbi:trans-sialidase, putative, partial [Trypanosoma cruzi marinkellei]
MDGRRRVYESGDKGESWTEALGTLSRVWGNKDKRHERGVGSGFTTATMGDREVILVTLPVYAKDGDKKENRNEKGELHLWLTDNTHIVDIGPVSRNDDVAASSLLYKSETNNDNNEKLIALYEKNEGGGGISHSIWSVLLTDELQRVKEVLTTWKKVDGIVSKLCSSSIAAVSASPGNVCSAGKITAGLVGFLSGNFSGNTWRDEYLGVNARVNNNDGAEKATSATATGLPYGVKFQGAWAEWPVGKQGENQLYHFANYNFTLVATVSIHNVPEGDTPVHLMGAVMNDTENTVLLGLSYSKGKKWQVLCGGRTTEEISGQWEPEKTHQLAIVLQTGTQGSV